MTTILIGGYYGAGNLGDEAILECILKDFRAKRSDLDFFVTSWNPIQTSQEYKVKGVQWKDISGLIEACYQSDLIILGGGGLFQDYWGFNPSTYLRSNYNDISMYGSLPLLAKLMGIPCMIYAVGLGPFKNRDALQHTRIAIENSQICTLRDLDSLNLLRDSGYFNDEENPQPQVLSDPAFTLVSENNDDKIAESILLNNKINLEHNLIAVVLRHWDPDGTGLNWLEIVASGLNNFLAKKDSYQVILIPFQENKHSLITNDEEINNTFLKYNLNKFHKLKGKLTPRIAQSLIKKCEIVLGMRLHSLIMGINTYTPIVGLPYDPKISSLMKNAGLEDYLCTQFPPDSSDITEKLESAFRHRTNIIDQMKPFQKFSYQSAKKNTKIALDLIVEKTLKPKKFIDEFPIQQIKLINELDKALEVASINNSELLSNFRFSQLKLEKATSDLTELRQNLEINKKKLDQEIIKREELKINFRLREEDFQKKLIVRDRKIERFIADLNTIYRSNFWKLASSYYSWINKFKSKKIRIKDHESIISIHTSNLLDSIVATINNRSIKGVFILTSTLPFDELFNQRVMNLAKFLSQKGYGVIFVAWRWTPSRELIGDKIEVEKNIFQIPIDLFLAELDSLINIIHQNKNFILEFPHPDLFSSALRMKKFNFMLIYEIIDDWECFHNANMADWFDSKIEKSLILNANFITAVSKPLINKFSNIRQDIKLLQNGYDPNLLGKKNRNISKEHLSQNEINIGYFGHLTDSWFDWNFLKNLSHLADQKRINLKFHLIGYGEPDLTFLENIEKNFIFYGKVHPSKLYSHAKKWDLAMIPFKLGLLSESVDPIKFYEYSFFGLPIIVRGITHLANKPNVIIVSTELDFLDAIWNLDKYKQTLNQNRQLNKYLSETTWESRFTQLILMLDKDPWMF